MIAPGDTVIGAGPSYSHPAQRAVVHSRGDFIDTAGLGGFKNAIKSLDKVDVVFLTRLAVTYEILPENELNEIIGMAHGLGARIILDDAGGARVGPACFDQPKMLELGVENRCDRIR